MDSSARIGESCRATQHPTLPRFPNRYLIYFKGTRSGPIESDLRFRVGAFRGDFGRLRLGQKRLILDHEIIRGESDRECLLFHIDGLLLKDAALDCGFISGASLPQGDLGVGNLQANLILQLLAPHLSLPDLQFVAHGIRLGNTIPHGQRQLQPDAVGREVVPEDLPERAP